MATYYVSPYGNNSNDGLGSSPNNAWLTVGKALGTTGISSGDTVYICPGTYRETVDVTMTSPTIETFIRGDPKNTQGFIDNSGNLVKCDEVIITGWTQNEWNYPTSVTQTLRVNNKNYLTFEDLVIYGYGTSGSVFLLGHHVTIRRCVIAGNPLGNFLLNFICIADINNSNLVDSCIIWGGTGTDTVSITLPMSNISEYDANITIKNCILSRGIRIAAPSALTYKGGGLLLINCTSFFYLINTQNTNSCSTTYPAKVYNNLVLFTAYSPITAITSGQILEDNNYLNSTSLARTNVVAGLNTMLNPYEPQVNLYKALFLNQPIPWYNTIFQHKMAAGFDKHTNTENITIDIRGNTRPIGGGWSGTNTTTGISTHTINPSSGLYDSTKTWNSGDYIGQVLRIVSGLGSGQHRRICFNNITGLFINPAWMTTPDNTSQYEVINPGLLNSVGAFEYHNTAQSELVTVDTGKGIYIIGPGTHDFYIPVTTRSTTIAVKARYDTNYGGTNKPQAILMTNGEIGLTVPQTGIMTGNADTWETITFTPFTPSGKSWVTVQLQSRSDTGYGKAYFDTFTIS